ncbi:MAG: hypothetical protein JO165_10445 [Candidatus Eremiobacteraeota bacterium]|nr:hypothetical protein [Candidatus Eremiobacteraeota bacterium]
MNPWRAAKSYVLVLSFFICVANARADCTIGKTMQYSDIEAIRYVRSACYGTCTNYEVLYSRLGNYYVGRDHVKKLGTYQGIDSAPLKDATALLRQQRFFEFHFEPIMVTDVPHYIVAVQRCGVTTKLDWPAYSRNPKIERLFDSLDNITNRVDWHKRADGDESPRGLLASIP